jgi:nucleotide-binding universal stress UspA family protein
LTQKKAKFSKILVAIDGSEHSMNAAEYDVGIARDNRAELIALTVLDITKIGMMMILVAIDVKHAAEYLVRWTS